MRRLNLALALHNHQPVGNFDWVVDRIYQDAYLPMVEALERHPRIKVALHYSGYLLDWLLEHRPELVERVAALVARGQVEMLGGGYYEPVLPAIPDRDKRRQLERLKDAVERHFGRAPTGLWLAERVWEESLPRPLAEAGYRYTILDDSHFERVGLAPEQLYSPFLTEEQGHPLTLLATGTKMRYLIPWRSVEECLAYFRETASLEPRLVLMGDDGEKFGGWPTTAKLCWEEGWVDRFFTAVEVESDWLETVLPGEYVERHPGRGPVYLPAGSYPEMLRWSGGFWRNFMTRYPEVNAMHKKMLRVSAKVEAAGSPEAAVADLHRGQANDAYWHGIFGGVYLPHLRGAIWKSLVAAEAAVAPGDGRTREQWLDYDLDGDSEVLIETPAQNLYLAPALGAAAVEWDAGGRNLADCLARREEPYHARLRKGDATAGVSPLEEPPRVREPGLAKRLHYDRRRRLLFQAYLARGRPTLRGAVASRLAEIGSFAAGAFEARPGLRLERTEELAIGRRRLRVRMEKTFGVSARRPEVSLALRLSAEGGTGEAWLLVECNLSLPGGAGDGKVGGLRLDLPADLGERVSTTLRQPRAGAGCAFSTPHGGQVWYYPVETVNNSEDGYERVVQGACLVAIQRVRLGAPVTFRYRIRSLS
jgi:alpha-amylase